MIYALVFISLFANSILLYKMKTLFFSIFLFSFTKTCPCNVYPYFYIAKLGNAGVYRFFLFLLQNIDCFPDVIPYFNIVKIGLTVVLLQNIDCGYWSEPPRVRKNSLSIACFRNDI